jgi:hypothetical protein
MSNGGDRDRIPKCHFDLDFDLLLPVGAGAAKASD